MSRIALGVWLPATLLAIWELLARARVLDPLFFPPPSELVASAAAMIRSGELPFHLRLTLKRTVLGVLGGSFCGLACGLLMGAASGLRQSLEPIVSALYSTPKLSLLPMLMLFLGIGDASRILLVALSAFVLTTMHSLDAMRNLNLAYVQMAVNYGARGPALFRTVYLPACLPQVFTGLRLAMGRGLVIAVSTELISSSDGLGSLIWLSWQTFSTDRLYVAVFATGILGALLHHGLSGLERRLVPWKVRIANS